MKNARAGLIRRRDTSEEKVSELEDRWTETFQTEIKEKKSFKKWKQ